MFASSIIFRDKLRQDQEDLDDSDSDDSDSGYAESEDSDYQPLSEEEMNAELDSIEESDSAGTGSNSSENIDKKDS